MLINHTCTYVLYGIRLSNSLIKYFVLSHGFSLLIVVIGIIGVGFGRVCITLSASFSWNSFCSFVTRMVD